MRPLSVMTSPLGFRITSLGVAVTWYLVLSSLQERRGQARGQHGGRGGCCHIFKGTRTFPVQSLRTPPTGRASSALRVPFGPPSFLLLPSSTPLLTLTNVYSGGTARCLCFPRLEPQPQGTTEPSKCGCCARGAESFISVRFKFKKPLVASGYCITRCNSKPTTKPPKLITLSISQED